MKHARTIGKLAAYHLLNAASHACDMAISLVSAVNNPLTYARDAVYRSIAEATMAERAAMEAKARERFAGLSALSTIADVASKVGANPKGAN